MQDRHIGDVRVTRVEEQMGPGFPAKDFFPEFEAETFAAEQHWLAPNYYQPESGRVIASIHSWLVRTGKHTVLIDSCSGNHKSRPGMPRFDIFATGTLFVPAPARATAFTLAAISIECMSAERSRIASG